ncbi:MAG: translation initiation factor IF-2 [Phototrophicales bacterium]|nr:MAG: translation initiation factor IF-2 [Phototrophicales bacterium]
MAEKRGVLEVPDFMTVRELSELMGVSPIEVMKQLIANGVMASINQQIDYDTAAIIIEEMGYVPRPLREVEEEKRQAELEAQRPKWRTELYATEEMENLQKRPPVVTILGHVDHGKTSLLDAIRQTRVADAEAGGITQAIGAYQITYNGNKITFIDTPGHEAFTAMRARGAQGADIAILVVAADDGVMPTTREALDHARAAGVPIVVALNKIDKPNANPEYVKQQLSEIGLTPDEWGGDTLVIPVSARTHEGLDNLLEAILLVAEDADIFANPNSKAAGVVLEGRVESGRGAIATLLVQNGTLKQGDVVVAGISYGRIKSMFDDRGNKVKEAEPSMPVSVMGLSEPPSAGERFEVVKNIKEARSIVEERLQASAEAQQGPLAAMSLEDFFKRMADAERKELLLIVKVDVFGSLEPVVRSLEELSSDDVKITILRSDIGNVTESDVNLASASGAIIIGFNTEVDNAAERAAAALGIEIRTYNIIYKLIEDVELALKGMLDPVYEDKQIGTAQVRQVFHISKIGNVAGCYVTSGVVRRNARARVVRQGNVLAEGLQVTSLKRVAEDVREVRAGFECGIALDKFSEFEEGDIIEFTVRERVN